MVLKQQTTGPNYEKIFKILNKAIEDNKEEFEQKQAIKKPQRTLRERARNEVSKDLYKRIRKLVRRV